MSATAALLNKGTATAEEFCRAFAADYGTPEVLRALALAEAGRITWQQLTGLFGQALAKAREVLSA